MPPRPDHMTSLCTHLRRAGESGLTYAQLSALVDSRNITRILREHPELFEVVPGKVGFCKAPYWRLKRC